MIKVRAIGAAEVQIGRRRITAKTEVVLALAVYLCVRAGERLSRDEVVAVFWPEAEEARGRHNLRQMLYRLRQKGFVLDEDGEELWLDPGRVEVDANALLEDSWAHESEDRDFPSSLDFLRPIRSPRLRVFVEWRDSIQARVAAHGRKAALRHLATARHEGRWTDVSIWAERILGIDPLNEEATLAKAESIALLGSKAAAIELLDNYVQDLGHTATRIALPASLLRRRIYERQHEWGPRRASDLALIGRTTIIALLTDRLEAATRGAGSTTLLYGPPGVGKSRLARELRDIAELRGFRCVEIRTDPSSQLRPFSATTAIAQALCDLPGSAGSAPDALAILSSLVREARAPSAPAPLGALSIPDGHIEWAFTEILTALSSESRLLICIDDVHHLDWHTWGPVIAASTAAASLRAMLVLCSRKPRPVPEPYEQRARLLRTAVPALDVTDARAVAEHHAASSRLQISREVAESIAREANGNPLFTRELTSARLSRRPRAALPASLVALIDERLEHLDSEQTRVVRAVALLGPLATLTRIRLFRHASALDLSEVLEALESEGIISLVGEGRLILHDCWRQAIMERMSPAVRASLSLELADLLASERPPIDATERAWGAGTLYLIGGQLDRAFDCFSEAGDRLLARGLSSQALEAYRKASQVSERPAESDIEDRLARAAALTGDLDQAIAVSRDALGRLKPYHASFECHYIQHLSTLADTLWRAGKDFRAERDALARAITSSSAPGHVIQYAALIGLRLVFIDADSPYDKHFLEAIRRSTESSGPSTFGALANLIWAAEKGSEDQVHEASALLAATVSPLDPPHVHALVLRYRATAHRWIGEGSLAASLARDGAALARSAGALEEARNCYAFLAFLALDEDDQELAAQWLEPLTAWERLDASLFQARQLRHARSRLLIQSNRNEECYRLLLPFIAEFRSDTLARRRIGESACFGLSAAGVGDTARALEMITETGDILRADTPSAQLDMPAEFAVRALVSLGMPQEANALASEYLRRREAHFRRVLPRAARQLREMSTQD